MNTPRRALTVRCYTEVCDTLRFGIMITSGSNLRYIRLYFNPVILLVGSLRGPSHLTCDGASQHADDDAHFLREEAVMERRAGDAADGK